MRIKLSPAPTPFNHDALLYKQVGDGYAPFAVTQEGVAAHPNGCDFEYLGDLPEPSPLADRSAAVAAAKTFIYQQNEAWKTYWTRFESHASKGKEKPLPLFDDYLELQDCYAVYHPQRESHVLYWQVNYRVMLPSVRIGQTTYRAARTLQFRHFAVEEIGREPYFFAPKESQAAAPQPTALAKTAAPPVTTTKVATDAFNHDALFYKQVGDGYAPFAVTQEGAVAASVSGEVAEEAEVYTLIEFKNTCVIYFYFSDTKGMEVIDNIKSDLAYSFSDIVKKANDIFQLLGINVSITKTISTSPKEKTNLGVWDTNVEFFHNETMVSSISQHFKLSEIQVSPKLSERLPKGGYNSLYINRISFLIVHEVLHTYFSRLGYLLFGVVNFFQPDDINIVLGRQERGHTMFKTNEDVLHWLQSRIDNKEVLNDMTQNTANQLKKFAYVNMNMSAGSLREYFAPIKDSLFEISEVWNTPPYNQVLRIHPKQSEYLKIKEKFTDLNNKDNLNDTLRAILDNKTQYFTYLERLLRIQDNTSVNDLFQSIDTKNNFRDETLTDTKFNIPPHPLALLFDRKNNIIKTIIFNPITYLLFLTSCTFDANKKEVAKVYQQTQDSLIELRTMRGTHKSDTVTVLNIVRYKDVWEGRNVYKDLETNEYFISDFDPNAAFLSMSLYPPTTTEHLERRAAYKVSNHIINIINLKYKHKRLLQPELDALAKLQIEECCWHVGQFPETQKITDLGKINSLIDAYITNLIDKKVSIQVIDYAKYYKEKINALYKEANRDRLFVTHISCDSYLQTIIIDSYPLWGLRPAEITYRVSVLDLPSKNTFL